MIKISTKSSINGKIDTLAVFVTNESGVKKSLPEDLRQDKYVIAAAEGFEPNKGSIRVIYTAGDDKVRCVLLCGLGSRDRITETVLRECFADAARRADKEKVKSLSMYVSDEILKRVNAFACGEAVADGVLLSLYRFIKYQTQKKEKHVKKLTVIAEKKHLSELKKGIALGEGIALSVANARDLVTEPSNRLYPQEFAKRMKAEAEKHGITAKVLKLADIKKEKMGGLLSVSQGSDKDPVFLILHYKGTSAKDKKKICLVGKGICFDSGGISLKPSRGMGLMKYDMAGGAAMANTVVACAASGVKHEVIGLIPLCENMPDSHSYKPGDVIRMRNGLTVEVSNTDAEGRLILADALDYAGTFSPDLIIDAATLTGACKVALGTKAAAILGNDGDMIERIQKSGADVGERVWQLPLWKDYKDDLKSDIADLNNIGSKGAGTITAAMFLSHFVPEGPSWIHLDIASVAWDDEGKKNVPKGASGFGVRLLSRFLREL